jgi:hypothetical protein
MSGRSEDNSRFASRGRGQLIRRADGTRMGAEAAWAALIEHEHPERVAEIVAETRANWIDSFRSLLGRIEVPTVLLWFSKRSPDYQEAHGDVHALFGEFPQLVNRAMVDAIRPLADEYAECVTSRGSPQRLTSRFTGEPATFTDVRGEHQALNTYYPSPEMHADAAAALVEPCKRLLVRADG